MNKKIMILGSTGLLGTSLEQICNEEKVDFIGITHKDLEITDDVQLSSLIEKYDPTTIINTIALIGINFCENNPKKTLDINANAVFYLAKICKKRDITLIQASTHAVFDGEKGRYIETDKTNPINIYGYSKLISEYYTKMNALKYYVVRFPTMYGSRRNTSLGFVDKMINAMKEGKNLKIASDRMDSPTYALDAAKKIIELISTEMPYGTYHIANKGEVSYYNFINLLSKLINYKGTIEEANDKDFLALAPNPLKVSLCSEKIDNMRDWDTALKEYVLREKIEC